MKKSEQIISSLVLMALGVLFILLRDDFIGILMTVAGGSLIALGIVDLIGASTPQAVIKLVSGLILIIAGWAIVEAVLYLLSGICLIFGVLTLYEKIKDRSRCGYLWQKALEYATPAICIAIGGLLLFHRGEWVDFTLIVSGILIILEGGVLLTAALARE